MYRQLEKQLRVWYMEAISSLSVTSSMSIVFFLRNCKSSGLLRIEESLDPLDTTTVCKAFVCWAGLWNGLIFDTWVRDRLDDIEGEVPISKEAADPHRANTMRAQYLSSDRPEIQVECPDLVRKLQQPSNLDEMGLKRLARYLGVRLRLVWLFKWQKRDTHVESCVTRIMFLVVR